MSLRVCFAVIFNTLVKPLMQIADNGGVDTQSTNHVSGCALGHPHQQQGTFDNSASYKISCQLVELSLPFLNHFMSI
jgi:hypothetical protein